MAMRSRSGRGGAELGEGGPEPAGDVVEPGLAVGDLVGGQVGAW